TMICPYVEQGNLLNITKIDRSVIDPINLPPPIGISQGGGTKIKLYQCPSAPERDAPYGPYFQSVGLPTSGAAMNLGTTDYNVIRGLRADLVSTCGGGQITVNPTNDSGALGKKGE